MSKLRKFLLAISTTAMLCAPWLAHAQFTTLHAFHDLAAFPTSALLANTPVGGATKLFGVAFASGGSNLGAVYSLDLSTTPPTETLLHAFSGPDGSAPVSALIRIGPVLYGTTRSDAVNGPGTVFSMSGKGANQMVIYKFRYSDGAYPSAKLTAIGGYLYGTTLSGGSGNAGSVFKMDLVGHLMWSHGFTGGADGQSPSSGLIRVGQYLYGVTPGGAFGAGTVYRIKLDGTGKQTIYTFTGGSNGVRPMGELVMFDGSLFGVTQNGGTWGGGTVFRVNTNGSNFQTVYHFAGGLDGGGPSAGLVIAAPNPTAPSALYGSTSYGGLFNKGTLFKMSANGSKTTLYEFTDGADGQTPSAKMLLANGMLYGTTDAGGAFGKGTVFSLVP